MYREWKFRVSVQNIQKGAAVFVVGNCPELGSWHHISAVELAKESSPDDNSLSIWSAIVKLPIDKDIDYRYFIAIVVEPSLYCNADARVVLRWETHISPRNITKGVTGKMEEASIDSFGFHGGVIRTQRGWLTNESIVQLKLCNNPIQIWKSKFRNKQFRVKITPVEVNKNSSLTHMMEDSTEDHFHSQDKTMPFIEVGALDCSEEGYQLQEQFGRVYYPNDFLTFQAQVMNTDSVAYLMDIYLHDPHADEEAIPPHVGFCYILPSNLRHYMGMFIATVTNNHHQPLGQVTVEYVVIHPIQGYTCNMLNSYAGYWKSSWTGLDIGHRGAGAILPKSCSNIKENTIVSLNHAARHGMDIVEFDVQLSKDKVPVIYHDFHVRIAVKKKSCLDSQDFLEIPVKDLTYAQLQMLKFFKKGQAGDSVVEHELTLDDHPEEHQPFPSLERALQEVDESVGFNIEIKAAMQLRDGSHELNTQFELNMYLDEMLKVILTHGRARRIIFSSFHPDICTMLRSKQNRYPILFLTMGVTDRYPPYMDPRTHTSVMAIAYAKQAGILGISAHAEELLKDPHIVQSCKDASLVMFCWGEDNNDKSVIKKLKEWGVDGVIYDKVEELSDKAKRTSFFTVDAKEDRNALLKVAGYNAGSGYSSDGSQDTR